MGLFDNFNTQRGYAAFRGGQQGAANYDAIQQNQAISNHQLQAEQLKQSDLQNKQKQKEMEKSFGLLRETTAYIRQFPIEERELAAKSYLQIKGQTPDQISQIENTGIFQDLSDQRLEAFMDANIQSQVLNQNQMLTGQGGREVISNRPNINIAAGGKAITGGGDVLATNPVAQKPPSQTTDVKNFQAAQQGGYKGSFLDYQKELKNSGRSNVTVNNNENNPSVFEKAVDSKYADDYIAWRQGGGSDNAKLIDQLDGALDMLGSGQKLTGPVIGIMPDALLAFTNPQAIAVRDRISEVVQRNLRAILGPQFTEKEGQQLIARAFNPKLGEEENARRVRALVKQIKQAAASKEDAAQYVEKNATLRGWKGKQYTKFDFEQAVSGNDDDNVLNNFVEQPNGRVRWVPKN